MTDKYYPSNNEFFTQNTTDSSSLNETIAAKEYDEKSFKISPKDYEKVVATRKIIGRVAK